MHCAGIHLFQFEEISCISFSPFSLFFPPPHPPPQNSYSSDIVYFFFFSSDVISFSFCSISFSTSFNGMPFLFYLCNISLIALMFSLRFFLLAFSFSPDFCFSIVAYFILFLLCWRLSSNTQLSLAVLLFKSEALGNHLASAYEKISLFAGGYNAGQWRKLQAFYLWPLHVHISMSFLWICCFLQGRRF